MSSNEALRRQAKKEKARKDAEEKVERRLYDRARSAPEENARGSQTFGVVMGVLTIAILLFFLIFFGSGALNSGKTPSVVFTGDNCTCVGRPGRDGVNGQDGAPGRNGTDGQDGKEGPPGFCEFHPNCMQGPPGQDGADGKNGTDGVCAVPCVDGDKGDRGPPGFNGTNGINGLNGINGTNGIDGKNGTNGVCDCFDLANINLFNATIENLTVNGTLTFDASSCPALDMCDLKALSLVLDDNVDPTNIPTLQVGSPQASQTQDRVLLGERTPSSGTHRIKQFEAYAETSRIYASTQLRIQLESASNSLILQNLNGAVEIDSGGSSPIMLDSSGAINLNSETGTTIINTNTNDMTIQNQGTLKLISGAKNVLVQSKTLYNNDGEGDMVWQNANAALTWMVFNNSRTYNGTAFTAGKSIRLEQDVLVNTGKRLYAQTISSTTGLVTIEGDLTVTGDITATGACCTSDRRMKTRVKDVSRKEALERVLSVSPKEFYFTEEYQAADKKVGPNQHRGFIAQELEQTFPHAVSQIAKKIGHEVVEDLRQLHQERLIADLWAAVQQLHGLVEELQKERFEKR